MQNLNNKKGFALIEVICSITIFLILFMVALEIQLNSIKLKKSTDEIYRYSTFVEELKNIMIYNSTYEELKSLDIESKHYVSKESIILGTVKNKGISNIFQQQVPAEMPYLVMNIEGDKVLKINIKLYTSLLNNDEIMECEFYKGKYKK